MPVRTKRPVPRIRLEPRTTHSGAEYAVIAKASAAPWRLGQATAMALEDSLQQQGWPEGAVCGAEEAMALRFGVGVRLMRQAVRILEARGACRTQRGRGGGLIVQRPDRAHAAAAMADTLLWNGVRPDELAEAKRVLEALAVHAGWTIGGAPDLALQAVESVNPGLALALACLDEFERTGAREATRLSDAAPGRVRDLRPASRNRASQVAWRIAQTLTYERCKSGERIGSLWDLAGQHNVSLSVATSAVRILEDADLATCTKGRRGGVTLKAPDGDAVISVVHGYLAVAGMTAAHCTQVCHALNLRAARKVAELGDPATVAALEAIFGRMSAAQGDQVMQAWYELQKRLHEAADNRVLHLLTRCLAAFCVRTAEIDVAPPAPAFLNAMVEATTSLIRAIQAGDGSAAEAGQEATRAVLDDRQPMDRPWR